MKIIISEVEVDSTIVASTEISKLESKFINQQPEELKPEFESEEELKTLCLQVLREEDEVASTMCSESSNIDPITLYYVRKEKGCIRIFKSAIGSTNITK